MIHKLLRETAISLRTRGCNICITASRTKGPTRNTIDEWANKEEYKISDFRINNQKDHYEILDQILRKLEELINKK